MGRSKQIRVRGGDVSVQGKRRTGWLIEGSTLRCGQEEVVCGEEKDWKDEGSSKSFIASKRDGRLRPGE